MLKVVSPLSPETEKRVEQVIGCCIAVHRALGPGLLEHVYSRAVVIEFRPRGIGSDQQRIVKLHYRRELLCTHRLDLVVEDTIVVELKCVDKLHSVHFAQLLGYLRASRLRVGLLVNFNVPVLREGLKRIVL
jgi:GxxExxY protein